MILIIIKYVKQKSMKLPDALRWFRKIRPADKGGDNVNVKGLIFSHGLPVT